MPTVAELADQAEREFAFLTRTGWLLAGTEIIAPASFKGGFVLTYALDDPRTQIRIKYLDLEFEIWKNGRRLFGSDVHPGFAGNMFSRERLEECLPRLANAIPGLLA